MKKISVFLAVLIIVTGGAAGREAPAPEEGFLSLDPLLLEARQNNPDIQAAFQAWQAAVSRAPQASALPDPMLRYTLFGQSIETRLGPQRYKFSLAQTVPFFGKLPLKARIADSESRVMESRYRGVMDDVLLGVKEKFFTLLWLDGTLNRLEEEKDVLGHLIRVATAGYEAGKAGQQDILKAQLELTRIQDRLLEMRQSRRAAAAQLNALLYRPSDQEIPSLEFAGELPDLGDREGLKAEARANRPEIALVEHVISRDRHRLDLANKNFYPDFQVMVEYVDISAGTSMDLRAGRDAWMASVGVTIPLWRGKLKAGRAEAETMLRSSRNTLAGVERRTEARVHELYDEIETAREQYGLYKKVLLPQAEQTLKASEAGYRAGRVDFLTLLESQRMILTIRTGIARIYSEVWKGAARLERLIGRNLESISMEKRPLLASEEPDRDGVTTGEKNDR